LRIEGSIGWVDIGADGAITRLTIYRLTPIASPLAP
jgi:hypothetical protein